MGPNDVAAFEEAVLAQAPPGAVIAGASISPDGKYGVALTFLPAANYLMDDILTRTGEGWEVYEGGSGGGLSWSSLGRGDRAVVRLGGEAPEGATEARISCRGQEHSAPVRHGHFLFVAWNVSDPEWPRVIGFE